MLKGILRIGVACICGATVHAQVQFTGSYAEDFDVMGLTAGVYPEGWSGVRAAGSGVVGASLAPVVTAGSVTGGNVYNVGTAGGPDRALGSLASSSTTPRFGLQLRNATGSALEEVNLSGVMEQWRSGSSAAVDERLVFEWSLGAADIHDAAAVWVPAPAFDLMERLTGSASAGAVDGNLAEHQLAFSGVLNSLAWADQSTLTFRWTDLDNTGSDGLLALDNFQLSAAVSPVPEPAGLGTFALGLACLGLMRRVRRA